MKWKIVACAVVVVLILAQMLFGGKKAPANPVPPAVATEEVPSQNVVPAKKLPPSPDDVVTVAIGSDVRMKLSDNDWVLIGDGDPPADGEKVVDLLYSLLSAPRRPVSLGDTESTGLGEGGGLSLSLGLKDGSTYDILVGLRPAGTYNSAYVRYPDDGVKIVSGDVRGDLGLWRNVPGAIPEPSAWLEKRALSFYVSDVVRVEAVYPDHRIAFEKNEEGVWRALDYVPGDNWSRDGLIAWLTDLSEFQIAGIVPADEFSPTDSGKTYSIAIMLDDGTTKTVNVQPNHGGEGMLAMTSDYPDRVFHLAEWRFRRYFRRLSSLFPDAVPHYDLSQVRFIDFLRGGIRVKVARRDDGWHPVNLNYPLRVDQVERLVRLLSSWYPEDYAAPDPKTVRPHSGNPMVEISLEGGDVHQYRLAGRHPLFPWRYVVLDGREIFSVTDPEAGVMFPGFAEVLDLGRVFDRMTLEDVDNVRLSAADGTSALTFFRNADGSWSVGDGEQELGLTSLEAERILGELVQWRVTGFYDADAHPAKHPPQYIVRLGGSEGGEQEVTVFQPEERDIPYLSDGGRGYLVDRADFQNWLGAVREAGERLALAVERAREDAREREAAAAGPEETRLDAERESGGDDSDDFPAGEGGDASGDGQHEEQPAPVAEDPPSTEAEPESDHGIAEDGDSPAVRDLEPEGESEAAEEPSEPAPENALEVEKVAIESERDADGTEPLADEPGLSPVGSLPEAAPGVTEEDGEDRSGESVAEVLGEMAAGIDNADAAEDREETAGEPAGGDVLIHPDIDVNVAGDIIRNVTGVDDALIPEAEIIHNVDSTPDSGE